MYTVQYTTLYSKQNSTVSKLDGVHWEKPEPYDVERQKTSRSG